MADSIEIIIQNEQVARERIKYAIAVIQKTLPGGPVMVTLGREKRSLDQNAKLWAMLADISKQVVWHGQKLSNDTWKNIFTAALFKQDTVPGIDGGFVVLGKPTSKMRKRPFAELIELIYAFGAERGVKWSEKSDDIIAEYKKWLDEDRAKQG